jgi:hypothetical protein
MGKPKRRDLLVAALSEIRRRTELVFDVAANTGMMLDNVKYTPDFVKQVGNALIQERRKFSDLPPIA